MSPSTAKNLFRVSFRDSSLGQSHTLLTNDSHDKKQWLCNLRKVSSQPVILPSPVLPTAVSLTSNSGVSPTTSPSTTTMVAVTTTALLSTCHQQEPTNQSNCNHKNNNNNNGISNTSGLNSSRSPKNTLCPNHHPVDLPSRRLLRKRSSENSLQVQSIEAACRGSLACIFTAESHSHNGHSPATTLLA